MVVPLFLFIVAVNVSPTDTAEKVPESSDKSSSFKPEPINCTYQPKNDSEKGETYLFQGSSSDTWKVTLSPSLQVQPFQTLLYTVRFKLKEFDYSGHLFIAILAKDCQKNVLSELFAPSLPDFTNKDWQSVEKRFVAPSHCTSLQLHVWAQGKHMIEIEGAEIRLDNDEVLKDPQENITTLENPFLDVHLNTSDLSFMVRDKRCDKTWKTFGENQHLKITKVTRVSERRVDCEGVYLDDAAPIALILELAENEPQLNVTTKMDPKTTIALWAGAFSTTPAFFAPEEGHELVVPLGEGFLYPTDDPEIPAHLIQLADGSGLTMPWFGVVDNKSSAAAMCFTRDEDDALARLYFRIQGDKEAGTVVLDWLPQKNMWGYDRMVSYWFADNGGYVALCKRYRQEALETKKLVTFAEKRKTFPSVDRLLGAPNCWFHFLWHIPDHEKRLDHLRWLHEHGVDRMLFSVADALGSTDEIVSWGYVTTAYDLYTDVWPEEETIPAGVPGRTYGFPEKVLIDYHGGMRRGWVQKTPAGEFPSYVLCPSKHETWAKERIPPMLKQQKRLAHFFDTTAGLPLYECYSPLHPLVRKEDKKARIGLFQYAQGLGLLVGSEMGVDWAVPYLAYCEGMLSPVPYRHPDAGTLDPNMQPTENTFKYQLNPAVRVPLWELVYHDCCIAYWYWGDCTNTFPELWHTRNLFNALYATPPMYLILKDESLFFEQRERIVDTHLQLKPVFEAVGFSEMTFHRFLSDDRKLQESVFSNGTRIVVNFSEESRRTSDIEIPAMSFRVIQE